MKIMRKPAAWLNRPNGMLGRRAQGPGSQGLKSSALPNVTQLARFLQENPERQVIVEGYTDSVGSASYNQGLSERRAESVRRALIRAGVEPTRIVAQGYGKEYPVADNSSDSGRAQNRRVEVTISNDNQPVAPRSSTGA